jgi:hypothetical protein
MSIDQIEGREKRIRVLKRMGLPHPDSPLKIPDEASIKLPATVDIVNRCLAVSICAVKGETNNQPMVNQMVSEFSVQNHLTSREKDFISDTHPLESDLIKSAWLYECVHIFLWSLGYLARIQPPDRISDVVTEMAMIWKKGRQKMIEGAQLRPNSDILEAADLYQHLHWAVKKLRTEGQKIKRVNEDVVMMRNYTINWLINHRQEPWQPYLDKP